METLTNELQRIDKATVSQDAKEFMKDQALITESLGIIANLKAERGRLSGENKSLQAEVERLKKVIEENNAKFIEVTANNALLLNEIEARFDRTNDFDSIEIYNDYMTAAKCAAKLGRVNNRIIEAEKWYNEHSLNF